MPHCDAQFLEDWLRDHGSFEDLPPRTYVVTRPINLAG